MHKANAVARIDNLEFLSDVIPRTSTFKEYKEKKARATRGSVPLQTGQTTLYTLQPHSNRTEKTNGLHDITMDDETVSADGTIDDRGTFVPEDVSPKANGTLVFEHYEPNGTSHRDRPDDVEMG